MMKTKPFKIRKKEHRAAPIERTGKNTFTVIACVYDVVDDYNTRFVEGCFDEYAAKRLPTFVWSHDWSEPIGRTSNPRSADLPNGTRGWLLDVTLDAVPAVPRAMQAQHQLGLDGDGEPTLTDVSIGFCRIASQDTDEGVTDITGAECDEVSVVLVGAVPGAKVLMSRSGKKQVIDAEKALGILVQLGAGTIDVPDAMAEMKAAAVEVEEADDDKDGDKDADKDKDKEPPKADPEKDKDADQDKDSDTKTGDNSDDKTGDTDEAKEAEEAELLEDVEAALALAGA